jgi:hypothetical protein
LPIDAEHKIARYLEEVSGNNEDGKFHVQGWLWHTMSLVREAKRLNKLALKLEKSKKDDEQLVVLKQAADYLIGFNMKGLHNIEKDLFFPWMRKQVKKSVTQSDVSMAFDAIMDQLESDRKGIENLGAGILHAFTTALADTVAATVWDIADKSAAIVETSQSMLRQEEAILVPAVARFVSE